MYSGGILYEENKSLQSEKVHPRFVQIQSVESLPPNLSPGFKVTEFSNQKNTRSSNRLLAVQRLSHGGNYSKSISQNDDNHVELEDDGEHEYQDVNVEIAKNVVE
jgi:hypothetical protein